MRRRLLLAASAIPLAIGLAAVAAPGCGSDEPPIDDLCNWIKDPANCYRGLYDEVRTRCGAELNPNATADEVKASEPKGAFLKRDALDICVLENGGQVTFEELPTLDQFPVKSVSFTRLDALSQPCAMVAYTNDANFTLTLYPCNQDESDAVPVCKDAINGETSVSGEGRDPDSVVGGTFSQASEEGRDIYNATCPPDADGEVKTYRFNINETSKCTGYTQFLPHAEIDSDAGRTVPPWIANEELEPYAGWVRFRLFHAPYAEVSDIEGADPVIIQYYNCLIPPQNPCSDGIKNFYETDTDCGGPTVGGVPPQVDGALPVVRSCDRCEIGMRCLCDADCKEGSCVLDSLTGFNTCVMGGSGTGGGGGGGGGQTNIPCDAAYSP